VVVAEFTYYRGEWINGYSPKGWIDGVELPEWDAGEPWEDWLRRVGFNSFSYLDLGNQDLGGVGLYARTTHGGPPFLASVCPLGDCVSLVVLPDVPSLMMFIRDYAAPFSLVEMREMLAAIKVAQNRAFRAWHGHDADDPCPACDPAEWAKREQALARICGALDG
jgi:hypothetical protein